MWLLYLLLLLNMNTSEITIQNTIQNNNFPLLDTIINQPENICDFVRAEDRHHTAIDLCDNINIKYIKELSLHEYKIWNNELKIYRNNKKITVRNFINVRDLSNKERNLFFFVYDFQNNRWYLDGYANSKQIGL